MLCVDGAGKRVRFEDTRNSNSSTYLHGQQMLVNVRHVATRQLWVVFSSVDITATINLQLDDRACLDKDEKGGASCRSVARSVDTER